VCTFHGRVDCTCPDATQNFAACKHTQALRALGLIPKSARPAGQLTWDLLHPRAQRKARVAAPAAPPAAVATPSPDPLARARRRHQPTTGEASLAAALLGSSRTQAPAAPIGPAEDLAIAQETAHYAAPTAASFAAGFRTAVAEHAARLATGGVS